MKKIVLFSLLAIVLVFGFIGCDNGNGEDVFTVTFNSNGGSAVAPITGITSGATITLPSNPTRGTDDFSGWFVDNNTFQNEFTASTPVTANLTVFARWTQNGEDVFAVTFDLDGGNISGNTASVTRTVVSGGTVASLPANPSKANNTFGGWFTQRDGAGTQFTSSTTVTGNIIVYANWTADQNNPFAGTWYSSFGGGITQVIGTSTWEQLFDNQPNYGMRGSYDVRGEEGDFTVTEVKDHANDGAWVNYIPEGLEGFYGMTTLPATFTVISSGNTFSITANGVTITYTAIVKNNYFIGAWHSSFSGGLTLEFEFSVWEQIFEWDPNYGAKGSYLINGGTVNFTTTEVKDHGNDGAWVNQVPAGLVEFYGIETLPATFTATLSGNALAISAGDFDVIFTAVVE